MESGNKNILFFDICRLCLDKRGVSVIFEMNDLSNNIYTCTGIKIMESDNLPNKICKTCLEIVTKFIQLKTTASKNDKYLRTLFSDNIVKEENTVDSSNIVEEDTQDMISYYITEAHKMNYLSVRKDLCETSTTSTEEAPKKEPTAKKMLSHKDKKASKEENQHKCTVCSKIFTKWKKYYLHQRSHNKKLVCPIDICGKKFATKGDLEKHIRAHTGEKPFECDECDKSFTQRVSLKAHKISIHNMSTTEHQI